VCSLLFGTGNSFAVRVPHWWAGPRILARGAGFTIEPLVIEFVSAPLLAKPMFLTIWVARWNTNNAFSTISVARSTQPMTVYVVLRFLGADDVKRAFRKKTKLTSVSWLPPLPS
jgi:hypothetical protein